MVGVTWVSDLIVCFCMSAFVCVNLSFTDIVALWFLGFGWFCFGGGGVLFGRFSGFSLGVLVCGLFWWWI